MFDYFDTFFIGLWGKNKGRINARMSCWEVFCLLLNIVINRFKFNLPKTMDDRFLNICLISTGRAGIIRHEGKLLNLRVTEMNTQSTYGYPINLSLVDYCGKGYGSHIPNIPDLEEVADCALVYLNKTDAPPIFRIIYYANRLAELQTQIGTAISNIRASIAIRCEKEQKKQIESNWREAGNGKPLFLDYSSEKSFGGIPEIICNPQTSEILKTLYEAYDKELARFCSEFGITSNSIMNKLSGINTEELKKNDAQNQIILNNQLNTLKEGLKKASELFGEEMSVELNFNPEIEDEKENDYENEDISGTM